MATTKYMGRLLYRNVWLTWISALSRSLSSLQAADLFISIEFCSEVSAVQSNLRADPGESFLTFY